MKLIISAVWFSLLLSTSAFAVLAEGDSAPEFSVDAITNNELAPLSLSSLLARGPVVLYFSSSSDAFGCNDELRALADSSAEFDEFHTHVVSVVDSEYDEANLGVLSECDSNIAIVSDPEHTIAKAFEADTPSGNSGSSTSVVISPDNEIIYVHASTNVHELIDQSIEAVQEWSQLVDQEY